jgi:hypothetical protein
MKIILICSLLLLMSCGNHPTEKDGIVYNCYGGFDHDEEKKPNVIYEVSVGNMIGTVLFSETIFVPIWNLGWNVYCPTKIMEIK